MNTPNLVSVFLIFSIMSLSSVSAQEVEEERDFDYLENSGKGPEHWGDLNKEWAACKNGDLQSPIDMSSHRATIINNSGYLKTSYKPCAALLKNRGHDILVKWPDCDAGSIMINGTDYPLKQAHWHSPSEHTIDGRRYAMELHVVHQSKDPNLKNNVAVIGVLYRFAEPDAFLSKLMSNIESMADELEKREVGVIDPNDIINLGGDEYYRYMGSLTVPPCSEGVIWIMNKEIGNVSRDQVRALRKAVHDYAETNARPLQPINHRPIELYSPK
ncbi:alpha carbonic anhydrase 2 [Hibiscus trionum]|uniref:Carbonic anhydrase n=1 Tax=Hibiscus trionum TaxID=183268 RepID=A0A9W7IWD1_HIBTR|nr:alpha carbonic anhydrase 2 [Hibiscus trionum]